MEKSKDALALLRSDHQKVSKLFAQAQKNEAEQETIFAEINAALTVHATIEEEIFYPAVKSAKSEQTKDEVLEALAEHKQIKALLAELAGMAGDDESFAMKLKVLKEDVEHHVKEEQDEMFPDAKKSLGEKRLVELGAQLDQRKRQLMSEMDMEPEDGDESEMAGKSSNGNSSSKARETKSSSKTSSTKSTHSGGRSHSSHKDA